MTIRALAQLVTQSIRRGRRSFMLSAGGIAVGISSLTFFLGLSIGVRQSVLARIFPVGQLEVVPSRANLDGPLSLLSLGGPTPLTDEAAAVLRARPEVKNAYRRMKLSFPARAWGGQSLFGKNVYAELIADGVDADAMASDPLGPLPFADLPAGPACSVDADCRGGAYCPSDSHRCEAPVPAMLSPFIVELYNSTIAPSHGLPRVSQLLQGHLRGLTFTVELGRSFLSPPTAGVAKEPHQRRVMLVGISTHASPLALTLPLPYVRRWNAEYAGAPAARQLSSVLLELRRGARVAPLAEAVRQMGYEIADSGAERAGLAVSIITLLLMLVSLAILGVASLNIAHNFYRAVAERRREFGVLRAVGATGRDIQNVILAEAATIGACGGLVGLAFARLGGWLMDWASRRFLGDFPFKPDSYFDFRWFLLAGALSFSVLACVAGAAWPAHAASRLEPTEALTNP